MNAYKLFKKRRDGTLGPLFINCSQRIPIGEWVDAELHPRSGYAVRKGWHCMPRPKVSHLSEKEERVWCEAEIKDVSSLERPEHQGGVWYLAQKMRVIKELPKD